MESEPPLTGDSHIIYIFKMQFKEVIKQNHEVQLKSLSDITMNESHCHSNTGHSADNWNSSTEGICNSSLESTADDRNQNGNDSNTNINRITEVSLGHIIEGPDSNSYGFYNYSHSNRYNTSKHRMLNTEAMKKRKLKNAKLRLTNNRLENMRRLHTDLLQITTQDSIVSGLQDSVVYTFVSYGVLLIYGILLGLGTLLDWLHLSFEWVVTMLVLRSIFTVLFMLDFYMQYYKQDEELETLLRKPCLYMDLALIILDFTLIVFLIVIMCRYDAILDSHGEHKTKYNQTLLLLRSLSSMSTLHLYKFASCTKPLVELTRGILLSIKSQSWTALFILVVLYSSSIFTTMHFNDIVNEEMNDFYGNIIRSMYTMFTVLTLEGWNEVSNRTAAHYPYCKIFFVIYVCFATLTVMNVVTGIILNTYFCVSEEMTGDAECTKEYGEQVAVAKLFQNAIKNKANKFQHSRERHSFFDFERNGTLTWEQPRKKFSRDIINENDSYNQTSDKIKQPLHVPRIQMIDETFTDGNIKGEQLLTNPNSQNSLEIQQRSSRQFDNIHLHPDSRRLYSRDVILSIDESISRELSDDDAFSQDDIIDMTRRQPMDIMNDPTMKTIFDAARIPLYQVYDVLNLYYMNGLNKLTAAELYRSCNRLGGKASSRHLLCFEISLTKRLDDVEQSLSKLNNELKIIATLLSKQTGVGGS
ncbi:Ion transport domain [Babesia duncani]|uniref:Ion transport domain n=1 Tax=Babesia duncani TaxID=323732 RepID=A0AAD9PKQ5_9APIC|nr:Ion transport domain [Babesia duncani]